MGPREQLCSRRDISIMRIGIEINGGSCSSAARSAECLGRGARAAAGAAETPLANPLSERGGALL